MRTKRKKGLQNIPYLYKNILGSVVPVGKNTSLAGMCFCVLVCTGIQLRRVYFYFWPLKHRTSHMQAEIVSQFNLKNLIKRPGVK